MLALADVAVGVRDAKASARWWHETMGFETHTVGAPGSHALMVAPPGDRFVLHLCEGFEPVEPGNTGIAFVTDEIEAWVARMQAAGVRFPQPLTRTDWGGSAKFADPDGNIFWLVGAPTAFVEAEVGRRAGKVPTPSRTAPRRRDGRRAK